MYVTLHYEMTCFDTAAKVEKKKKTTGRWHRDHNFT
jgi:hypothetical protein